MESIILDRPWQFDRADDALVMDVAQKAGIPKVIARLLCQRGIDSLNDVERHLCPGLGSLSDPWEMADMEKAVERLVRAVERREPVAVFGDYDADGITATALMSQFLTGLGLDVAIHIPHRVHEGYGLNIENIKRFNSMGIGLVITVDCGISNHQEIAFAAGLGMDVIVTDHHEPPRQMPQAMAVLNPKRPDCGFAFKEIAGVGVAFNLVRALRSRLYRLGHWANGDIPNLKTCLDLVAIGTIADMVPLIKDNRIMVKTGLEVIRSGARMGIRALMETNGVLYEDVTSKDISFRIAPRINAAGRIAHAEEAFKLLVTDDHGFAIRQAEKLSAINQERRTEEAAILKEAQGLIKNLGQRPGYVLYSQNWHKGIIGIVASKLVEQILRPVILLTIEDGKAHGSGRSPEGLNLHAVLSECADQLVAFGGHKSAAGVHLLTERLEPFIKKFEDTVSARLKDLDLTPRLKLDCPVPLEELTTPVFQRFFELLEPFGFGYPVPVFAVNNFTIHSSKVVGNSHLKLTLTSKNSSGPKTSNGSKMEVLAWGQADKAALEWEGLELACTPCLTVWQHQKRLELRLQDARHAA